MNNQKTELCHVCNEKFAIENEHSLEKHNLLHKEELAGIRLSNEMKDAVKTICHICKCALYVSRMREHTKKAHSVHITEYKLQYNIANDRNYELVEKIFHRCAICTHYILLDSDVIACHIRKHKITHANYNAQYMVIRTNNDKRRSRKKNPKEIDPPETLIKSESPTTEEVKKRIPSGLQVTVTKVFDNAEEPKCGEVLQSSTEDTSDHHNVDEDSMGSVDSSNNQNTPVGGVDPLSSNHGDCEKQVEEKTVEKLTVLNNPDTLKKDDVKPEMSYAEQISMFLRRKESEKISAKTLNPPNPAKDKLKDVEIKNKDDDLVEQLEKPSAIIYDKPSINSLMTTLEKQNSNVGDPLNSTEKNLLGKKLSQGQVESEPPHLRDIPSSYNSIPIIQQNIPSSFASPPFSQNQMVLNAVVPPTPKIDSAYPSSPTFAPTLNINPPMQRPSSTIPPLPILSKYLNSNLPIVDNTIPIHNETNKTSTDPIQPFKNVHGMTAGKTGLIRILSPEDINNRYAMESKTTSGFFPTSVSLNRTSLPLYQTIKAYAPSIKSSPSSVQPHVPFIKKSLPIKIKGQHSPAFVPISANPLQSLTTLAKTSSSIQASSNFIKTSHPKIMGKNAIKKVKLSNGRVLHLFIKDSKAGDKQTTANNQEVKTIITKRPASPKIATEKVNNIPEDPLMVDTDTPVFEDPSSMDVDPLVGEPMILTDDQRTSPSHESETKTMESEPSIMDTETVEKEPVLKEATNSPSKKEVPHSQFDQSNTEKKLPNESLTKSGNSDTTNSETLPLDDSGFSDIDISDIATLPGSDSDSPNDEEVTNEAEKPYVNTEELISRLVTKTKHILSPKAKSPEKDTNSKVLESLDPIVQIENSKEFSEMMKRISGNVAQFNSSKNVLIPASKMVDKEIIVDEMTENEVTEDELDLVVEDIWSENSW